MLPRLPIVLRPAELLRQRLPVAFDERSFKALVVNDNLLSEAGLRRTSCGLASFGGLDLII